jgi:hypothetical protein
MARTIAFATLSLLMLCTLLWGGCISCEQFFMVGSAAKKCCAPDGHCKSRSDPTRSDVSRECKQIAIEHSSFLDHSVVPPSSPHTQAIALPSVKSVGHVWAFGVIEPSPPDLQTLHSTFLI